MSENDAKREIFKALSDLLDCIVAYDDGGFGIEEENRQIVESAFETAAKFRGEI